METYLVGGAVRDALLGRAVRERDWVVTGATPADMLAAGFRAKDPDFPVFLHPDTGEEYALARRERKLSGGHRGFSVEFGPQVTLEEDLARRDLTVNAMAQAADGALIDPYGGRPHLDARRLRHVTPAFEEDPLRVLRLARLAAELAPFRFQVDPETAALAATMSAGEDLLTLSAGRIWRETARALQAPEPARYFELLRDFGALSRLMPWLACARDPGADAAIAALRRCAPGSAALPVRLAALAAGAAGAGASGLAPAHWPVPAPARALEHLCVEQPPPAVADPVQVMSWLEAVDGWRRADRLDQALLAWSAADPARAGDAQLLRDARDASLRIAPPAPGQEDPRAAVRQARMLAVEQALGQHGAPCS